MNRRSFLSFLAPLPLLPLASVALELINAARIKTFHPGGSLGASRQHVADVMHKGDAVPLARDTELMGGALVTMTQKAFGCLGIVDAKGKLIGIVTDGDLRRHMGGDLVKARTADIMTRRPKTATPKMLASAALEMINAAGITALFVVDKGKPVGIVHVHDLLRAGVA
jgi:arabinose-5-phosphate isomerase